MLGLWKSRGSQFLNEMSEINKILILSANPKDTDRLRLDEEVREIEEGLQRSQYRTRYTIQSKWAVGLRDLRRLLLDHNPRFIHFCGHGQVDGLLLENTDGNSVLVKPDALAGLFELFASKIECVFLNACYSDLQAKAINKHIRYVVGIRKEISDKAAVEFALGFYDALGAGESIEAAFRFGRNAIQLCDAPEHLNPILLKNTDVHSLRVFDKKADDPAEDLRVYRFRAELEHDVNELCKILGRRIEKIIKTMKSPYLFMDTEVEIHIDLSLEELRDAMREVEDGHVMVQTVTLRDQYTGKRDYSLK